MVFGRNVRRAGSARRSSGSSRSGGWGRAARRNVRRAGGGVRKSRRTGTTQTVRLQLQLVPAQGIAAPVFDRTVEKTKAKAKF